MTREYRVGKRSARRPKAITISHRAGEPLTDKHIAEYREAWRQANEAGLITRPWAIR